MRGVAVEVVRGRHGYVSVGIGVTRTAVGVIFGPVPTCTRGPGRSLRRIPTPCVSGGVGLLTTQAGFILVRPPGGPTVGSSWRVRPGPSRTGRGRSRARAGCKGPGLVGFAAAGIGVRWCPGPLTRAYYRPA